MLFPFEACNWRNRVPLSVRCGRWSSSACARLMGAACLKTNRTFFTAYSIGHRLRKQSILTKPNESIRIKGSCRKKASALKETEINLLQKVNVMKLRDQFAGLLHAAWMISSYNVELRYARRCTIVSSRSQFVRSAFETRAVRSGTAEKIIL